MVNCNEFCIKDISFSNFDIKKLEIYDNVQERIQVRMPDNAQVYENGEVR